MKKVFIVFFVFMLVISMILVYYFYNYSSKLIDISKIKTDSNYENIVYENVISDEEYNLTDDFLGILEIQKIGLKATIKEGSSSDVLKRYIGHIEETSKYDGNIGLVAHNRGNEYSYFARLNELKRGDIVTYKTKFYERQYKVNNIQAIFETDWSKLENTDANKLTMITCISNKRNQRLCVQAVEI
ncbi:MAG: class D sortase [Clostridia bacterium]|nr:class D sortase [Clostridia bacterium]